MKTTTRPLMMMMKRMKTMVPGKPSPTTKWTTALAGSPSRILATSESRISTDHRRGVKKHHISRQQT